MKRKFYFNIMILAAFFMLGSNNNISALGLTITQHPVSIAECSGYIGTLSFSVTASGLRPTYQWQQYNPKTRLYDNISGATLSTLSYEFTKLAPLPVTLNGLRVRCAVTDYTGTVYSNAAYLYVNNNIISHPASQTVVVGSPVTFSVSATGKSLTYQWQRNTVNITGATSSSYTIEAVKESAAGQFRCVVSGPCGTIYSNAATLTVYPLLEIVKHPVNAYECDGGTATFDFIANITSGLTYQWQYLVPKGTEWINITGGTTKPLVISPINIELSKYSYRCIVSGAGGQSVTTNAGMLYIYTAAYIYSHPDSATKATGESVTFNVTAGGTSVERTYQWQKNSVDIVGATSSSLTISNLTVDDGGTYRCIVKNICNPTGAISNGAVLTVTPPPYPEAWFSQTSGTLLNLTAISAVSNNVAYAIQSNEREILKTSNGGTSWNLVATHASTNIYPYCVDFIDANNGFVGGYYRIAKTINGGTDWTLYNFRDSIDVIKNSGEYPYMYAVQMVSSSIAYAVGTNGMILKTTNGGTTWTAQNYKGNNISGINVNINAVHFLTTDFGFAVGNNGVILKTTNGGSLWTYLRKPDENPWPGVVTLSGVYVINTNKIFICGSNILWVTNDGGTTWTQVTGLPTQFYHTYTSGNSKIKFVDADNGYLVGYKSGSVGVVLKTKNGGTNWFSQKLQGTNIVNAIDMANANDGFICSQGGQIQRTAYGGCVNPVVSLYEDKTFCSGANYQLVADTFARNYNVTYLWTPGGQTTGTKTVTTTDTYSVTLTNECNVTATDAATITFRALPDANAGVDAAICNGETTQLNASGGTAYLWNNAGLLDNSTVPNPVTVAMTNTTIFTVTVTDDYGCSKSDNVTITVNPIPSSDFNAPEFICGTDKATISYASSTVGKTFEWNFGEGDIDSAMSTIPEGPYQVNWDITGDKVVSLITTQNNCVSSQTQKIIQVRTMPSSVFLLPETVCGSSQVTATYTGTSDPSASYTWNFNGGIADPGTGQGPHLVSWLSGGTKTVTLQVVDNGCTSSTSSSEIYAAFPYEGTQICVVTIDLETGKNMVVWERTPNQGIASYNVYRNVSGTYELLGNVPFDNISLYVDMLTNPESYQAYYKISAVDTCGNESSKSNYHRTMFLQYIGNQLSWDNYLVEGGALTFTSNKIYRGTTPSDLVEIMTLDKDLRLFTDVEGNAGNEKLYYRVAGVLASECAPADLPGGKKASSGPFVHAFSNLEDNQKASTGINNLTGDKINLTVYPNPFSDNTILKYTLNENSNVKIEIYNIVGERVAEIFNMKNQAPGSYMVPVEASQLNNQNGLYYVKVFVNDGYAIRKIMMAK